MRKLIYLCFLGAGIFFLAECKAGKNASKKNPGLLKVAQKRWPSITQHDLDSGQVIFTTKCTKCHPAKGIPDRTEAQWQTSIDHMAPKAKLTPEQKEILTHYIFAAREFEVKKK
jgi:cytochrome c5